MDLAADVYLLLQDIGLTLDRWNSAPRRGRIQLGGLMTSGPTTRPITDIPSDDIPVEVQWQDRLGANIPHSDTDTHWSVEDDQGQPFAGAHVQPILDGDDEETGTLTFTQSSGTFRVVAETQGASGMVRAESPLYHIRPGAPALGKITLHVGGGSGGPGGNGPGGSGPGGGDGTGGTGDTDGGEEPEEPEAQRRR
jgi:hypothetical protein